MIQSRPSGDLRNVTQRDPTAEDQLSDAEERASEPGRPSGMRRDADLRVAELVRAQLPFVWRFLRRLGLSAADADDAAQQVFVVATSFMDRIEPGKERAFHCGVAYRLASNQRRALARRATAMERLALRAPEPTATPEAIAARRQALRTLDAALARLSVEQRTVLVLSDIEGLARSEVATVLSIPSGTVASRLMAARRAFRSALRSVAGATDFREEMSS